jgi:hypothetical protein
MGRLAAEPDLAAHASCSAGNTLRILRTRYHASHVWHTEQAMQTTTMNRWRDGVSRRRMQREFVARGLASRDEARRTGEYVDATHVQAQLERMLEAARAESAAD